MSTHLSVRMAWHDNKWDGTICKDPEGNVYCTGSRSLLSDRIARNKDIDTETGEGIPGVKIDSVEGYLPPCYWSANAFGPNTQDIAHRHPFWRFRELTIPEKMAPYSTFTWPFRISFNHSEEKVNAEGSYPKDLEKRIKDFIAQIEREESLVFYYLNYDNPVSGDDRKFALAGCAVIKSIAEDLVDFDIAPEQLRAVRSIENMQNFPSMNWAIQVTADVPKTGIRLPYHEYLERIKAYPEEDYKLREMRVLVDEPGLVPRFKYVSETLDDDKCIYLLQKIYKALKIAEGHGIVDVSKQQEKVESLLEKCWHQRGLYPGLGSLIDLLAYQSGGAPGNGQAITKQIKEKADQPSNQLNTCFEILGSPDAVPPYLSQYKQEIAAARIAFKNNSTLQPAFAKLCLFNLTSHQLERILFQGGGPNGAFRLKRGSVNISEIKENPYILAEEYLPEGQDLEHVIVQDEKIGLFTIDIGMFPDHRYMERNFELQDLSPSGPERIRAVIVEQLRMMKDEGHAFASLDNIYNNLIQHPLFYREQIDINQEQLVEGRHKQIIEERLVIKENEGEYFLYLPEILEAEKTVQEVVETLVNRPDKRRLNFSWLDSYLNSEATDIARRAVAFDPAMFKDERGKALRGAIQKSFLLITGKPGSGKTHALRKVIEKLKNAGEGVILLTPTGKASLRAKALTDYDEVRTIDWFLSREGFRPVLDDLRNLGEHKNKSQKPDVENLIIDECSMVDLDHMAALLSTLSLQGGKAVKRLIMVGDENQLAPIGCGKPFHDIVAYVNSRERLRENHFVRLEVNCRQESDPKILEFADLFVTKNRYYPDLLEELKIGGQISPGLFVAYWKDKDTLFKLLDERLEAVFKAEGVFNPSNLDASFNRLFGLFENGYVPKNDPQNLRDSLDTLQLMTPYTAGYSGTLGLNQEWVRQGYKQSSWGSRSRNSVFGHSEKVIRIQNWYWGKDLKLSNGSVGVVCDNKRGRRWYFPDAERPISYVDDEENFELAYAISVHKSQGSEFKHCFFVMPRKTWLLSRELVYTALTRSKAHVHLFIQKADDFDPVDYALTHTSVLLRNSSLLQDPWDARKHLNPEADVWLKSKVEYIIYRSLAEHRIRGELNFTYEQPLSIPGKDRPIKPDFTIDVGDRTYLWEHLGILDQRDYAAKWQERKLDIERAGHLESLITTDDLNGISQHRLDAVIEDVISGKLGGAGEARFSNHHYSLGDT